MVAHALDRGRQAGAALSVPDSPEELTTDSGPKMSRGIRLLTSARIVLGRLTEPQVNNLLQTTADQPNGVELARTVRRLADPRWTEKHVWNAHEQLLKGLERGEIERDGLRAVLHEELDKQAERHRETSTRRRSKAEVGAGFQPGSNFGSYLYPVATELGVEAFQLQERIEALRLLSLPSTAEVIQRVSDYLHGMTAVRSEGDTARTFTVRVSAKALNAFPELLEVDARQYFGELLRSEHQARLLVRLEPGTDTSDLVIKRAELQTFGSTHFRMVKTDPDSAVRLQLERAPLRPSIYRRAESRTRSNALFGDVYDPDPISLTTAQRRSDARHGPAGPSVTPKPVPAERPASGIAGSLPAVPRTTSSRDAGSSQDAGMGGTAPTAQRSFVDYLAHHDSGDILAPLVAALRGQEQSPGTVCDLPCSAAFDELGFVIRLISAWRRDPAACEVSPSTHGSAGTYTEDRTAPPLVVVQSETVRARLAAHCGGKESAADPSGTVTWEGATRDPNAVLPFTACISSATEIEEGSSSKLMRFLDRRPPLIVFASEPGAGAWEDADRLLEFFARYAKDHEPLLLLRFRAVTATAESGPSTERAREDKTAAQPSKPTAPAVGQIPDPPGALPRAFAAAPEPVPAPIPAPATASATATAPENSKVSASVVAPVVDVEGLFKTLCQRGPIDPRIRAGLDLVGHFNLPFEADDIDFLHRYTHSSRGRDPGRMHDLVESIIQLAQPEVEQLRVRESPGAEPPDVAPAPSAESTARSVLQEAGAAVPQANEEVILQGDSTLLTQRPADPATEPSPLIEVSQPMEPSEQPGAAITVLPHEAPASPPRSEAVELPVERVLSENFLPESAVAAHQPSTAAEHAYLEGIRTLSFIVHSADRGGTLTPDLLRESLDVLRDLNRTYQEARKAGRNGQEPE